MLSMMKAQLQPLLIVLCFVGTALSSLWQKPSVVCSSCTTCSSCLSAHSAWR